MSFNHGPDVPSCILNSCTESLVVPLTLLFNLLTRYGYFFFFEETLIPLHKSGKKSGGTHHSGIAILDAFTKIFQKSGY